MHDLLTHANTTMYGNKHPEDVARCFAMINSAQLLYFPGLYSLYNSHLLEWSGTLCLMPHVISPAQRSQVNPKATACQCHMLQVICTEFCIAVLHGQACNSHCRKSLAIRNFVVQKKKVQMLQTLQQDQIRFLYVLLYSSNDNNKNENNDNTIDDDHNNDNNNDTNDDVPGR